ncbi:protein-tyrosine phosphatase family protein [Arthrobacter sp. PM3]|uniref:protein-tyrosine phosphatase family protein n=1 Tax=Arthrobacter sp. PM3 TaxID=2017685 RepID=UPI000E101E3C|nr:protein-tyrosine phosphatase family protein [Arthrobacter sp. PM3]AXJ09663.1 protein phosphatase [Arthrobacter sp. PM3]
MKQTWEPSQDGVLVLPSGRTIRGRGLHYPVPDGPLPEFGLYLLGKQPPRVDWESRWLRWPDLRLPVDQPDALDAFREAWRRSETERVEVACWRGIGRTGTALACIAILDGVPPRQAVAYVRRLYHRRTVETPWQRLYVARFRAPARPDGQPGPAA